MSKPIFGELPGSPLVSIVVPSYNQGAFIKDTIDSILKQDYRPIRIHVIDGASTDNTVDVLKSYGEIDELDWVSEPDKGVVDAVNKGFHRVQGDVIAIQSSDDMYVPGVISKVVDTFRENANVGLVYGDTVKVDAEGNDLVRVPIGPWSIENLFLFKTWIPQPSAFFRREMLNCCGDWDESIPYAPDTDLWIRMAFHTDVIKLDEYLSLRRMHDSQRDTQGARIIRDFSKMIDQSPLIANSSPDLRKAARAAKHLIRVRYNPTESAWYAAWHLMRAGMIDSRVRDVSGVARQLLQPFRRAGSRVKRQILGRSAH